MTMTITLRELMRDILEREKDLDKPFLESYIHTVAHEDIVKGYRQKLEALERERERLKISNAAFEATITRLTRENEILRGNPGNWQKSVPANTNQASKLCIHWRKRELNPVYGRCAAPGASNRYCDCITATYGCPQSLFPLDGKPKQE